MYKNNNQQKEYMRKYYKKNKSSYAYRKRLEYWRNKYLRLFGGDISEIKTMTEQELRKQCEFFQ